MTKNKTVFLYWIIIIIPSLIIAGSAVSLLSHEQERKNQNTLNALKSQGESIAQTIELTIENLKDELTKSLISIPNENIKTELKLWAKNNPLIRNVFIWDRQTRLIYPEINSYASHEEEMFVKRYEALFSKRIPFKNISPKTNENTNYSLMGKRNLIQLARHKSSQSAETAYFPEPAKKISWGWMPWFMENNLYILGWVSKGQKHPVYGIELETTTLLSRIITDFPQTKNLNQAFALINGQNQIIHQSGSLFIQQVNGAAYTISLSNSLPHWKLGIYTKDQSGAGKNSFFYLSFILVLIFIASIISGGGLLLRQANMSRKEAVQKTSFVASVSHELKTPLTSIRMYAELLLMGKIKDEEKNKKYLRIIVSESERLTRLVNNVLDFSRLEQEKKNYSFSQFDIGKFLTDFSSANKRRFNAEGLELTLKLEKKNFFVTTDKDALDQICLNLADNILKYAGLGKTAEIHLKETKNTYIINFIDYGPGVPEKHRKLIFTKFHRVDNSLTAEKPGSGLGLSIAKKIAEDLGGDLKYIPQKPKGSCFSVEIPKQQNG